MRALRFLALSTLGVATLGAVAYGISRYLDSPSGQKSKRVAKRAVARAKRRITTVMPHSPNHHTRASA